MVFQMSPRNMFLGSVVSFAIFTFFPNATDAAPIHDAALHGDFSAVKRELHNGVDVDLQDNEGRTALILSAYCDHIKIAKYLLRKHADVNHADINGETALMQAMRNKRGNLEIVKLLIAQHADVNHADNNGETALMWAASWGHTGIVKILITHGAEVNCAANDGNTALIYAAEDGYKKTIKRLLAYGADANHMNTEGKTAFMLAEEYPEIVQLIQEHIQQQKRNTKLEANINRQEIFVV